MAVRQYYRSIRIRVLSFLLRTLLQDRFVQPRNPHSMPSCHIHHPWIGVASASIRICEGWMSAFLASPEQSSRTIIKSGRTSHRVRYLLTINWGCPRNVGLSTVRYFSPPLFWKANANRPTASILIDVTRDSNAELSSTLAWTPSSLCCSSPQAIRSS